MNIVVFDTETTGLDKPYCYNIGYVIINADTHERLVNKDFVAEQIWHNLALFNTAYYADKRPLYVKDMRSKKTILKKYGYIMQEMKRDFKNYEVQYAFAYNSPFDDKVFQFNCDWFRCLNPFDNVEIKDIRAYAMNSLITDSTFKTFCDKQKLYTESGNYSTSAETVYRYIMADSNFIEAHTALADSQIETDILEYFTDFKDLDLPVNKPPRSIERIVHKTLSIEKNKNHLVDIDYNKIKINKDKTKILLTEY